MTWLSRITFDPTRRDIRAMLSDGKQQHRYFMRLAPDGLGEQPRQTAGLLYRLEDHANATTALVQTADEPRLDQLPAAGVTATATRRLQPLLDGIHTGQSVRYRIVANPTKRWGNTTTDKAKLGKLHVLRGPAAEQWWTHRATEHGLDILTVEWEPRPDVRLGKHGRHAQAQFDGTATITDTDKLREALMTGIGRARSYGCGLLSIAILQG